MWLHVFRFGPFFISPFGLILVFSLIIFLFSAFRLVKDRLDINVESFFDQVFYMVFAAIVGGRMVYILEHTDKFPSILLFFLFHERPGFTYFGAVGGIALLFFVIKKTTSIAWMRLLDRLVPAFLFIHFLGYIGAFIEGFSFGKVTSLPIGLLLPGEQVKRIPLPLFYLSFLFLLMLLYKIVVSYAQKHKWNDGHVFLFYSFLYLLFTTFAYQLQSDGYEILGIRVRSIISLVLCIAALIPLARSFRANYRASRSDRPSILVKSIDSSPQ